MAPLRFYVRDFAEFFVGGVLDQASVPHLRVAEQLLVIVNRTAGDAGCLEQAHPMIGSCRSEHRFHLGFERRAVLHPLLVCWKTRVLAPFRVSQSCGATRPDRLACSPDH